MAILKMKRIRAAFPAKSRRALLRDLYRFGNVEIDSVKDSSDFLSSDSLSMRIESTNAQANKAEIKKAIDTLSKYVPMEKKLLKPKQSLSENELFDERMMDKAIETAYSINRLDDALLQIKAKKAELYAKKAFLSPWESFDLPLEYKGTRTTSLIKGTFPIGTRLDDIEKELSEIGGCLIKKISEDKELIYVFVIAHGKTEAEIVSYIRQNGFSREDFQGLFGTVRDLMLSCIEQEEEKDKEKEETIAALKGIGNVYSLLERGFDAYSVEENRDEVLSKIGYTKKAAFIEGWVAEENMERVEKVFEKYKAVYDFSDPSETEYPPTVLKSPSAAQPLNSITEMYGMPKYDSIIDPNPVMLPFYVVFFGAIMSDFMYGIIIALGCILGLKLLKPKKDTNMYNMLKLFSYCGVSTMVFGILTGSYFGDMIGIATQTFLGVDKSIPPLWFSHISDPMKMLVFSMALGFIQLCTGMGISAVRMIKEGKVFDAVFDVGSWYVIFIGLGLMGLGMEKWYYVSLIGVAMLVLTGGREKKNIFAKAFSGIGSLYGAVGFMSDVLSYSRIMALGLSGAVVGSVVNKMGAMGGASVLGAVLFILVAILGHVFNLGISVLGAYVHTSRLQYIEYFGRFYQDGGRIMKPLSNKTKYVNLKD